MTGKDVADRWFDQFGPGMFQSRKELAAMIDEALRAERERCAKIVHARLGADGHGVAQMIRKL